MALTVAMIAVSVLGISRIEINDNPVRWFRPDHKIRVADRVLNEHFAGTYNAFLVLQAGDASGGPRRPDRRRASVPGGRRRRRFPT